MSLGKFYVTPSLGMFNRSFEMELDLDHRAYLILVFHEAGYNFNKISIFAAGSYTTTLYGEDQTSTFYNFGLKYNFYLFFKVFYCF